MAVVPFPRVTVVDFQWRVDDPGRVVYENAYGPDDFLVGAGWTRKAGSITLEAGDLAEEGELEAFLHLLNGDDNEVTIPWDREWNGPGAFPFGTTFQVGSAADATWQGIEASRVVLNYKLPSDATASDIDLAKGSKLIVQQTFVNVVEAPADPGEATSTVTVVPRLTTGAAGAKEAEVKTRLLAASALLQRSTSGFLQPLTLAWREIP